MAPSGRTANWRMEVFRTYGRNFSPKRPIPICWVDVSAIYVSHFQKFGLEAPPGFEPGMKVLQGVPGASRAIRATASLA